MPAAVLAPGHQHLPERRQVVDRRHEPGAAARKGRGRGPLPVGRVVDVALAGLGIGAEHGPQAVALGVRHEERRVVHPQRTEHPLGQDDVEWLTRRSGDEHAEDVGARVVQPPGPGLVGQRHRADDAHPLIGPRRLLWRGWAAAEPPLEQGGHHGLRA